MPKLNPKAKAIRMLSLEVFYWGQKGLETTQRVSQKAVAIKHELIDLKASQDALDYWTEVNKEIYIEGK